MRKATAAKIIVAIVFPTLIYFITTCSNTPHQVEKVVIGAETVPHASLIWIAENKGFFQKEGLNVEIREFESGRTALRMMLSVKDIDIVTAAQTPVISHSFARNDYTIICNMVCAYDDVKIIVRRDRDIEGPSDLKGRSVGITAGSSGHFFLSLFLTHHQLTLADVKTIDIEATKLPRALADGQVDAIATWEPHIYKAKKALGEKAFILPSSGIYREDFYLIVRKDIIKAKPNTIKRFLRAIQRSEDFLQQKNTEAMDIVAQRLDLDKEILKTVWSDFRFRLFLDQTLLIALEDEARWAIRNKLTDVKKVPNYLDYIYPDALKEINPAAVSIAGRRD